MTPLTRMTDDPLGCARRIALAHGNTELAAPLDNAPERHRTRTPEPRFTLDGEAVEIADFLVANDFDAYEVREIECLAVGAEIFYGGGAAQMFTLKRHHRGSFGRRQKEME